MSSGSGEDETWDSCDYDSYIDSENTNDDEYESNSENDSNSNNLQSNSSKCNKNRLNKKSSVTSNFNNHLDSYSIFLNESAILNKVDSEAKKLLEVYFPDLGPGRMVLLLCKFNWDTERLIERYLEDSERVLKMANVYKGSDVEEIEEREFDRNNKSGVDCLQTCEVCFEEVADRRNPLCPHYYCSQCYSTYVQTQLTESQTTLIKCIDPSCKVFLDPDFLSRLISSDTKSSDLYNKKLLNTIVESNPQTSWCCTPKCEAIIWVNDRNRAKDFKNYFLNTEIYKEIEKYEIEHSSNNKNTSTNQENKPKDLNQPGFMEKIKNTLTSSDKKSSSKASDSTNTSNSSKQTSKNKQPPTSSQPSKPPTFSRKISQKAIFNPEKLKIDCDSCHSENCFNCGKAWHDPVTCEYLAKWDKKCIDDSETILWIAVNTKPCPKCHVNIEKNTGCNHMTCRSGNCKHEFCWLCLDDWSKHGSSWYKCDFINKENKEGTGREGDTSDKLSKYQKMMTKYNECYVRYDEHLKSLKFELETQKQIKEKMEYLEVRLGLSYIETQFLQFAAKTLTACRRTLMYCYVFYYYLVTEKDSTTTLQDNFNCNSIIFSDNLNDLHLHVEKLSKLLEYTNVKSMVKTITRKVSNPVYLTKKERDNKKKKAEKAKQLNKNSGLEISDPAAATLTFYDTNAFDQSSSSTLGNSQLISDSERIKQLGEYRGIKIDILNEDRYCTDRRLKLISHVKEGYGRENFSYDFGESDCLGYWSFFV